MNPHDRDKRLKKILNRLSTEDGKYICRLIYSDPLKDPEEGQPCKDPENISFPEKHIQAKQDVAV